MNLKPYGFFEVLNVVDDVDLISYRGPLAPGEVVTTFMEFDVHALS